MFDQNKTTYTENIIPENKSVIPTIRKAGLDDK